MNTYLLYGANGYTARLIIKESLKNNLRPVLAGRTAEKIIPIAKEFDLDYIVFNLDNPKEISAILEKYPLCLNAAGPFSKTAKNMIEGCLLSKTHYLDITGEFEVFELAKQYNQKAKEAGITILPGVGFDVVPSDCLANYLKNLLPDASHLELAFTSVGGKSSHGTMSTMVENLGESSVARINGKIERVPVGHLTKKIDFGAMQHYAMTIPWGDISTAYTSTKIPNILVYAGVPKKTISSLPYLKLLNPILRTKLVKSLAQKWVDRNVTGPNEKENQEGRSYFWGEVRNTKGEVRTARMQCKEGYTLTAIAGIRITKEILSGNFKEGYQTPAMSFGANLILELEGSSLQDVTPN